MAYEQYKVKTARKVITERVVKDITYEFELDGFEPDDRFVARSISITVSGGEFALSPETEKKYYDRGYADGYKDGYAWLTREWNFVHYKESGGYIPGGPATLKKTDYALNKGWCDGWKAGIDQYVIDTNYVIGTKSRNRRLT